MSRGEQVPVTPDAAREAVAAEFTNYVRGIGPASFLFPVEVKLHQKCLLIVASIAGKVTPPVAILEHGPGQAAPEVAKALERGEFHCLQVEDHDLAPLGGLRVVRMGTVQLAVVQEASYHFAASPGLFQWRAGRIGGMAEVQNLTARRRFLILRSLLGVYAFVTFASPILIDDAGLLMLKPHGWWREVDRYWLMGCAVLIAGWMALGRGQLAFRALQGLIAGGWLMLAWMLGLTISLNWRPELELTSLTFACVAAAAFVVLLGVRRVSGRMIVRADGAIETGTGRFQYSLATLLVVMLLICVTLTLIGWIDPRYRNYFANPQVQSRWYMGLTRHALELEVLKESLDSLLVAAACLPVFLSHHKRNFAWTLGLLSAALIFSALNDEIVRTYILFPLVQGKPVERFYVDYYLVRHATNLVTVAICLFTAAGAMRWLGYRIRSPA
jgi:hypothetical protein